MAIVVPITTEFNGKGLNSAIKEIGQAQGALGKLSSAGKILGTTIAAAGASFAVFQGAKFLKDATKSASDLQEALSKNKVIFGQFGSEIERFSDSAAVNLGQTQTQALNAASTFATFGKAANLTGTELVGFSTQLTTLASDLGSFYNVGTEEAITAIGAALRNETEPIRRFGVMINQASLEQKAFDMGLTKSVQTLTQHQRTLAAYALIMEQTTDAQGDFARTQDGLANTSKTLAAAFENAKASIGEGFLNAIQTTTGSLGGAQGLAGAIEDAGQSLGDLLLGIGLAVDAIASLKGSTEDATTETDGFTEASVPLLQKLVALIPVVGAYAVVAIDAGAGAREAAAGINAQYDSTIALAKAQRELAYEAQIASGKLADTARDPGLDRLKEQNWRDRLAALGFTGKKAGDDIKKSFGGASSAATALEKATDKAQQKFDKLAERVELSADRLQKATDALDAAKQAFSDYSADKSGWITGQVDLAAAIEAQIDQTARLADLDVKIAEALAAGDSEGAAKLTAEKAGEKAAVNWVDGFLAQIANAKEASNAINTLMANLDPNNEAGNKALLDALTTLTPEQAKLAATDLVTRGLGPQVAAELANLNVFAGATGDAWASNFYSEGINAAQAQVDGITARLNERLEDLKKQGRKMGKAVKDGYESVVNGLPEAARNAVSSDLLGNSGGVTIHVNAPVGDPIAIARTIRNTLRVAEQRVGR